MSTSSDPMAERERMATLGALMAGVIHEINNPIGSIVSNNEVMLKALDTLKQRLIAAREKNEPPPTKTLDLVDTLASLAAVDKIACERISGVVRSLKTFARADDSEYRVISLNNLIRDTLRLIDCQYKRRIQLVLDLGDLPDVRCAPQMMSQVLLNLAVNAAQAIEGDGTITVRSRRVPDGQVEVSIHDTGRGIAPEHRDRIFQTGFTTKALGVGSGLGLALCRQIVEERHGGRIWFESEPGQGTTFFVRIKEQ